MRAKKPTGNFEQQAPQPAWPLYFWLFLACFLLYFKVLFFDFTYLDDNALVLNSSRFLTHWSNLPEAFSRGVFHSVTDAYYRPMLTVSFMLDAWLGGVRPAAYHLSNILIHAVCACLVFAFFRRLEYPRALSFAGALIFAVHPVLTQAVAWIPGRNDPLAAVFVLGAMLALFSYLKDRGLVPLAAHALLFFLAMLTKETAAAMVPAAVLYAAAVERSRLKTLALPAVSWTLALTLWFFLRQKAFIHPAQASWPETMRSAWAALPSVLVYAGKVLFPFNLTVLPVLRDSTKLYGAAAALLFAGLFLFSKGGRRNFAAFGGLWFVLFLLPAFLRPNSGSEPYFMEHRLYLPIIGCFIAVFETTGLARNFNPRRKSHLSAVAAVLLLFSGTAFFYSEKFRDRMSFWLDAAADSPHLPLAHRNLGAMYYLAGRLDEAEAEFKKTLVLNSAEPMARNNLGLIYMNRGRLGEAEAEYKGEIALNPFYDDAYYNYGLLCYREGRYKEAELLWKKAVELNADHADAYEALAALYYGQNRVSDLAPALRNLERLGRDTGRFSAARSARKKG